MTALDDSAAVNKNLLFPQGFKLVLKRAPGVEFWVQRLPIPGLELGVVEFPTPLINIPIPGEHLKFDELEIIFKCDDNLDNYLELFNWLIALGKPDSYKQYAKIAAEPKISGLGTTCDLTALVVDSRRNINLEIVFADTFVVALSGITFDTTLEDITYINAAARFAFRRYYINKIA